MLQAVPETFPGKSTKGLSRGLPDRLSPIPRRPRGWVGRPAQTGWTCRNKCGSRPLKSPCVCALHLCTVWPIPQSNHGESEERRGMPAFPSFFPLSLRQTQVRLLFRPLLAQLRPLGLRWACFGPSREFLSFLARGLSAHFQPKMDPSPWMEQLWDPNTGTLQINFFLKEFTCFIFFWTAGYLAQNCTQAELGKEQDNLQDGTRHSRRWPLPTTASPGPLSQISLTSQAHKPPRRISFGQHPTRRAVRAVASRLLREGWQFPDTPMTHWRGLTTHV